MNVAEAGCARSGHPAVYRRAHEQKQGPAQGLSRHGQKMRAPAGSPRQNHRGDEQSSNRRSRCRATGGWHLHPDVVLGQEASWVQALQIVMFLPRVRVPTDPSLLALVLLKDKPSLQVSMVPPASVVQLRSRACLQRISRHVVEDVEERLQAELLQMRRLQVRWVHVVARRGVKLRVLPSGRVGPRRREGRVETLRGVQIQAEGCQIHPQSQRVEVRVRHPNHLQYPQQTVLFSGRALGLRSCEVQHLLLLPILFGERIARGSARLRGPSRAGAARAHQRRRRRWWRALRRRRLRRRHVGRLRRRRRGLHVQQPSGEVGRLTGHAAWNGRTAGRSLLARAARRGARSCPDSTDATHAHFSHLSNALFL
mmetsp:Transcript_51012/g.144473  ORF Transcript_51012/g.144473 Transcript_51012/m.144473 type:complete len:368 (+) Transcript_51012:2-1105(+)